MNLIDITASNTPEAAAQYKGMDATLTMADDTTISGTFLSVNSKGWNITVDGKTISRGFGRVVMAQVIDNGACGNCGYLNHECECGINPDLENDDADQDAEIDAYGDDEEADDEYDGDDDIEVEAAEDGIANLDLPGTDELDALVAELDGCTTAELADVFGMAAKELRVHLRALGMGVGKGHRYHLTADQVTTVRAALTPTA